MFRAIGFGITLIVLKVMMPDVFNGLESTLVKLFHILGDNLDHLPSMVDQTAMIYPHAVTP